MLISIIGFCASLLNLLDALFTKKIGGVYGGLIDFKKNPICFCIVVFLLLCSLIFFFLGMIGYVEL